MVLNKRKSIIFILIAVSAFCLGSVPFLTAVLAVMLLFFLMSNIIKERLSKKETLLVLINVLLGNVLIFIYNRFQNFIPYWDYAGYYLECLSASETMYTEGMLPFLKELYTSVCQSDYTKLPVLFTAPFMKVFGRSFGAYILINFNLYLTCFYFAMALIIKRINKAFLPLMFLFVPFLNPLLRGYIDSVGLVFVAMWLYTVFDDELDKIDIKRDVLLGICSVIFLFTRRWYLFFIVSLAASLLLVGIVRKVLDRKYKLCNLFINGLIIAGVMLCVLLVFFSPYVQRTVMNRFSDTYSAYQFGSFIWNVKYCTRYYGVIFAFFTVVGVVAGILSKRHRWFTLFLTVEIIIAFIMFTRIQTVSYHHQYLFAPPIFLLIIIGITEFKVSLRVLKYIVTALLAVNFLYTYIPAMGNPSFEHVGFPALKFTFAPKTNNVSGARALADKLENYTSENGGYAYILASSETINDELIKNAYLPDKTSAVTNLFGTAHVDKRDVFPNWMLVAKYIAVADPVQVHLKAGSQHLIEYFAGEILSGNVKNLEKIETVDFSDKVRVHIYERKRGFDKDWLDKTKNYFETRYPDYPAMYDIDYIYSQN